MAREFRSKFERIKNIFLLKGFDKQMFFNVSFNFSKINNFIIIWG